jgi:hypothetical protein
VRWFVTTPADADLEVVRDELQAAGAELESDQPIPLEGDEQALYAVGPEDLHERLADKPQFVRVNPHSDPVKYRGDIA